MARRSTPVHASTKIGIAPVGFTPEQISFSIFLREIFFTRLTRIARFRFVLFCFKPPFLGEGWNVSRGNFEGLIRKENGGKVCRRRTFEFDEFCMRIMNDLSISKGVT